MANKISKEIFITYIMTRTTEQLSNLIAEIDTKTSQGLG